ncbi:MAG: hypothetical protein IJE97_05035 [Thermoguttaceae bacterium]|nr:hypothetical protein [Thermoguttaceae bacterium]
MRTGKGKLGKPTAAERRRRLSLTVVTFMKTSINEPIFIGGAAKRVANDGKRSG